MDPNSETQQPNQAETQAGTEAPVVPNQTQTAASRENRGFFSGLGGLFRRGQPQQEVSAAPEPPPPPAPAEMPPPPPPMPDQTQTFASSVSGGTVSPDVTFKPLTPVETQAPFEPPKPAETMERPEPTPMVEPTGMMGQPAPTDEPTALKEPSSLPPMPDVASGPLPPPTEPASVEPTIMPPASHATPIEAPGGAPVSTQTSDSSNV